VQAGGRQFQSIAVSLPAMRPWDMALMNHPDPAHADFHTDWEDAITAWNAQPDLHPLLQINIAGLSPEELNGLHVSSPGMANLSIQMLDRAIEQVSANRAHIGGFINRFEYTSSGLQSAVVATSASLSRVMDTDMAYEMMQLSTNNILNQAGMAIMAQANARPQQMLQLLN